MTEFDGRRTLMCHHATQHTILFLPTKLNTYEDHHSLESIQGASCLAPTL